MSNDSTARIASALRTWAASAAPGARLPSTRALVAEHQASPVTVQKAIRMLAAEGTVETRPGVGTFLRDARTARPHDYGWQTGALRAPRTAIPPVAAALRPAPEGTIALHSGYPDISLLPERLVRGAFARAARGPDAFARPPVAGHPHLRAWFARELNGGATDPLTLNDVVIVPGSQAGLASVFRSVVAAGRPLLVESPTYWGAISAAAQADVRLVPIPTGPHGPDPDVVARAFDETGARAFYVQPHHANPTGAQWSTDVSRQVMDVVVARDAFLIEDDWAHDFGIDGTSPPLAGTDGSGHVVYLRSLTKSVSPSVRVAAVVARGPVRERILADAGAESMYVSGLLQAAALDVVSQPAWAGHLRAVRHQLRDRRDLMVESIRAHVPAVHVESVPRGGLNLWVRLPDGTDVAELVAGCEREGLLVTSGDESYPAEPAGPHVRLNYAGPDPGSYARAAHVLASVLGRSG
jgi:DNA-binding transcriptional MocR family regulator